MDFTNAFADAFSNGFANAPENDLVDGLVNDLVGGFGSAVGAIEAKQETTNSSHAAPSSKGVIVFLQVIDQS
ncbi:hypothetical protein [Leptolyngbya sp. 7M]|uniref:hypothetical protein n=1 Tax=Leptolyngbya sp. 7M TaxID=2812896 RepID=UPI001B8BD319|nr:hypothetical protein [Leptolyngbya sp. 7M]QYO62579.1 hypothetical protein JVX88_21275 [Leptolyngbya sp. 7M]